MGEEQIYAVFFYPQAVEALGDAIKPYLTEGPSGPHVLCVEVDTGGAFCEMTLNGQDSEGRKLEVELMVPTPMIRLIVSVHGDGSPFGFA